MANTSMSVIFSLIVLVGVGAIAQTTPGSGQAASTTSASPSSKIGVFVYPQKNQPPQQQSQDESTCYSSAQQKTGIDPTAAPAATEPQKQKGGAAKGAAGGAAGGAAIGAVAGDAGTGAAAGATAGAIQGRRQQKKANKAADQQAQQQTQQQQQQRLDTFRRAFSACMDSKGYSVR